MKLKDFKILGISSLVRDLTLLSDNIGDLEENIIDNNPISAQNLSSYLSVIDASRYVPGDLVVFSPQTIGAYENIEMLWGELNPLTIGSHYIGVMCNRHSTKLICAELPRAKAQETGHYGYQLIAQSGGIGFCTGFSKSLEKQSGKGFAGDVKIIGKLFNERNKKFVNLLDANDRYLSNAQGPLEGVPPTVLVLGSATDVGKTTLVCALLRELSGKLKCGAIKASGTGWFGDNQQYYESGALLSTNYTYVGLPTTYSIPPHQFASGMHSLYGWIKEPASMPKHLHPPAHRDIAFDKLDLAIIEHGGDILGANIPTFLKDTHLMASVRAVILCSESAVGLYGMLGILSEHGLFPSNEIHYFANMPLENPEGFFLRAKHLLVSGKIKGIVDLNKPDKNVLRDDKSARLNYSANHRMIMSTRDCAQALSLSMNLVHPPMRQHYRL